MKTIMDSILQQPKQKASVLTSCPLAEFNSTDINGTFDSSASGGKSLLLESALQVHFEGHPKWTF